MRIFAILALVLGIVLAGGAVKYMYGEFSKMRALYDSRKEQEPIPTVMVAVAKEELRYGMKIGTDSVRLVEWPADAAPKNAFNTIEDLFVPGVDQRTVIRQMEVNEPILKSKVTGFGEEATVTALLRKGMRAHTLPVDTGSSVAGFLHPGAQIDIYLTYSSKASGQITKLLMPRAEIIAVDQTTDPEEYKARVARTVTLEVTPYDSQRLILASRTGDLSFNLRGTGDDEELVAAAVEDLSVKDLLGIKEEVVIKELSETVRVRRGGFIRDSIDVPVDGEAKKNEEDAAKEGEEKEAAKN